MVYVYNRLPQNEVNCKTVSTFQRHLTLETREKCQDGNENWIHSFSFFFSLQTLQWYHDKISTSQGGQTMASVTCVHEEQCSGKNVGPRAGACPLEHARGLVAGHATCKIYTKINKELNHDTRTLLTSLGPRFDTVFVPYGLDHFGN